MDTSMGLVACGFLGGMVRSIIGLVKSIRRDAEGLTKKEKASAKPGYFLFGVMGSGAIGAFMALVLFSDFKIALLAGYCGMDLLENAMKLVQARLAQNSSGT